IRRPRAVIIVGSGESSRETSLYGLRIGSTCSTPAYPSSGSAASSSRSPIAPMTVASRPGVTTAPQPASSRRATTSATWSGVACAPITMRSSGAPVTAIATSLGRIPLHGRQAPRVLRHSADRPKDPRQLQRRLPAVRPDAGGGRRVLLHRRPPLHLGRIRPGRAAELDARPRGDALRGRPRRGELHRLLPEPCYRPCRGGVAAVGGRELRP